MKRMEKDMIVKRVYVGECAGSRSVGRPRKRWIDTVKECLRKRCLDIGQTKRMVQVRSEWRGFVKLMRCHGCGLPQLYEAFIG